MFWRKAWYLSWTGIISQHAACPIDVKRTRGTLKENLSAAFILAYGLGLHAIRHTSVNVSTGCCPFHWTVATGGSSKQGDTEMCRAEASLESVKEISPPYAYASTPS